MYKANLHYGVAEDNLALWGADPNCSNAKECLEMLEQRKAERIKVEEAEQIRRAKIREELQSNPFDSRSEVSADAKYVAHQVVKTLWIIFIAIPLILAIIVLVYRVFTAAAQLQS